MAYLTVIGPLKGIVGAYAALQARARTVVGGQCPDEAPDGRGVGAVMSDTALWLLSGRRAAGPVQPVEVHLVITDLALFGVGDPKRLFTTVRAPAATTSRKPPGWHVEVIHTGRSPGHPRQLRWTTPTGHTHHAQAPPLTGWGWQTPGHDHPEPRPTRALTRRRPRASPLERAHINRLAPGPHTQRPKVKG